MREPPASFVKQLYRFDPWLRVRWSRRRHAWLLERKIRYGQLLDAGKFRQYDDYVCARDGYVNVSVVPWNKLDRRVLWALRRSDTYAYGGAQRYIDALEEQERQEELELEAQQSALLQDLSSEAYEALAWRERRRVSLADPGHTHLP